MIFSIKAKIIYHKRISDRFFQMCLEAPRIAQEAKPGQFLNIKVVDALVPLLRRPFSVHRVGGSKIEVLYEVVGQATQILAEKRPGECLDMIGPLGNGFNYSSSVVRRPSSVVVAGGMGIAPLIFLAEKLKETKNQKPKTKILVLIGAKTQDDILCAREFKKMGCDVKIATDDGSRGLKGKVTELLKKVLRTTAYGRRITIYACGPRPMLREISRISEQYNIPTQISLEEHLSCGIGACLGCVVETRDGLKRVCKEGPVFAANQIVWEKD